MRYDFDSNFRKKKYKKKMTKTEKESLAVGSKVSLKGRIGIVREINTTMLLVWFDDCVRLPEIVSYRKLQVVVKLTQADIIEDAEYICELDELPTQWLYREACQLRPEQPEGNWIDTALLTSWTVAATMFFAWLGTF